MSTEHLDPEHSWWYNMHTTEVEFGMQSASYDRVGPFATKHEAEHAMDKLHENANKWEEDEEL